MNDHDNVIGNDADTLEPGEKTGFDKYFDERMKDPEFAAGYMRERAFTDAVADKFDDSDLIDEDPPYDEDVTGAALTSYDDGERDGRMAERRHVLAFMRRHLHSGGGVEHLIQCIERGAHRRG